MAWFARLFRLTETKCAMSRIVSGKKNAKAPDMKNFRNFWIIKPE
jgi:hypothetical protein